MNANSPADPEGGASGGFGREAGGLGGTGLGSGVEGWGALGLWAASDSLFADLEDEPLHTSLEQ